MENTSIGYVLHLELLKGKIKKSKSIFHPRVPTYVSRVTCGSAYLPANILPTFPDDLIPSPDLLEMVVSWIFEDPRLILITFLNTPIVTSPPPGFLELTPLCGLICWCVKAPLAYKRRKPTLSSGALGGKMDLLDSLDGDCHLLYSRLHLSILQVLMLLQGHLTEKNLYGRLGLVTGEQMASLVEDVRLLSDKLNPLHAAKEIELALDRLAQVLQVAMASGVLLWTRGRYSCEGSAQGLALRRRNKEGRVEHLPSPICSFLLLISPLLLQPSVRLPGAASGGAVVMQQMDRVGFTLVMSLILITLSSAFRESKDSVLWAAA